MGTTYTMWATAPQLIDGRAELEFTPALPRTAAALALSEPGVSTNVVALRGSTLRR